MLTRPAFRGRFVSSLYSHGPYVEMPLTIASVNPKGGSGKTTVAVHLAVAAHRDGAGVTLLDTDPQGSALDWYHRTPEGYDGPDVERVPADVRIGDALAGVGSQLVVMDSPARLDERTGAVLSASDLVLVPVRPSGLDLWGTAEFLDLLQEHAGGGLTAAFVGSQRDVRTTLSDELMDVLSELDFPLLPGFTQRVAYARSMSEGETVLDRRDTVAADEVRALLEDAGRLLT